MSIFSKSDDEDYENYLSERSMFGAKDRQEWQSIRDQARDISSGLVMGTFQRDEEVWEQVKILESRTK